MFRLNSGIFPFETDDHKGLIRLDYRKSDKDIFSFRQNVAKIFETNRTGLFSRAATRGKGLCL